MEAEGALEDLGKMPHLGSAVSWLPTHLEVVSWPLFPALTGGAGATLAAPSPE